MLDRLAQRLRDGMNRRLVPARNFLAMQRFTPTDAVRLSSPMVSASWCEDFILTQPRVAGPKLRIRLTFFASAGSKRVHVSRELYRTRLRIPDQMLRRD